MKTNHLQHTSVLIVSVYRFRPIMEYDFEGGTSE